MNGYMPDHWFQGRTLPDLHAVNSMTDDQKDTLERHVNAAYHHGIKEGRRQMKTWDKRLLRAFLVFLIVDGAMACGLLSRKVAEVPPRPTVAQSGVDDVWRLDHRTPEGEFIWVRSPMPGIHCFRESTSSTRAFNGGTGGTLGCITYVPVPPQ